MGETKCDRIKGEIDNSTRIVGHINTPLSAIGRTSTKMEDLNNTMNRDITSLEHCTQQDQAC